MILNKRVIFILQQTKKGLHIFAEKRYFLHVSITKWAIQ